MFFLGIFFLHSVSVFFFFQEPPIFTQNFYGQLPARTWRPPAWMLEYGGCPDFLEAIEKGVRLTGICHISIVHIDSRF